jgi:hypothetical protein
MDKQHTRIERQHPRIKTDIPCRISLPDAGEADATVLNLSVGGLLLGCDQETFEAILPHEQHIPGQVYDVHIGVKFSLRQAQRRAVTIQADARVIHSERLAQDSYHVGLQFVGMSKTVANKLEACVEEILAAQE